MKIIVSLLLAAFTSMHWVHSSFAQSTNAPSNAYIIGKTDTLFSNILKERRRFWISVPADTAIYSSMKFPVMYVLDGTGHFVSTTGMVHQLSAVNGNDVCPPSIVVSVGYPDRTRDLTPTHMHSVDGDTIFPRTSGGLGKFTDFLEKELIPHIEQNYPALPYRTYIGHSLGGLAVTHTLLTRPHMFQNYVALDPSLWWDDGLEINLAKQKMVNSAFKGKSLYVALANNFPDKTLDQVRKDTGDMAALANAGFRFCEYMETAHEQAGLQFKWKYYEEENHGSVPFIGSYHAMRFLFPWYNIKGLHAFFDPTQKHTADELVKLFQDNAKHVSEKMGIPMATSEKMLNELGYAFMQNDKMDLAAVCFKVNVENYPNSPNVHDSMGDYFMAINDKEKAIQSFEKAVSIRPDAATLQKLNQLKGK